MPQHEKPLVSIITPSFNQGAFIESTILSVLGQDYANIEYIVMDGGSTDATVKILEKYSDPISFWESKPDNGQTDAIIKGFEKAKGKYITWLCSDDVLEPSMISTSVAFLERDPGIVMTYGDRTRLDVKGNMIGYHRYCGFRPWLLKWGFAIPQETSLIRTSAYRQTEGLDASLKMAMDFDIFCKLSKVGKIAHIPAFLGRFRSHANNKSTVFDHEVANSGFEKGAPYELSRVYQKHFNAAFPVSKWNRVSQLNELLAFADRRSKQYKQDRQLAAASRF